MMSETPARPKYRDPQIVAAAVNDVLDDVTRWLGADARDPEAVKRDLIRCADDDAYRFAKNLDDRAYWYPDSDLVEILDGYSTWSARDKATKEWVSAHNITVPHAIGDVVTLRGQSARIVDIRAATAEIIAQPVEPDGQNYGDTGGWVHAAEDAKPVEVPA
ncbi:hypothetical protein [Bosea sp. Root381]|uniref:hypothetical protein n=1 Tax=Bosea sp. Root381 TaxID=1736524 RepID=UPI0006FFB9D0|nr:hypothetical protein [Bosea sp. Root381]